MATKTVEWKGGQGLKKYLRSLEDKLGKGVSVEVGFFESDHYTPVHPIRGTKRKPLPVAQVAFWMNYGTTKGYFGPIPARDFMGVTVRGNQGNWGKELASVAKATGFDTKRTMAFMGERIKDQMVTQIQRWSQPANGPAWSKIKGNSKPLVDDGTMQRAVGYQVKGV